MAIRWLVYQVVRENTSFGSFEVERLLAGGLETEDALRLARDVGDAVRLREDPGSVRLNDRGYRSGL